MRLDKWLLILELFAVILGIIIIFYVYQNQTEEEKQCLENPLVFGAKRLSSPYGVVSCSCSAPNTQTIFFSSQDNISKSP